MMTGSPCGDGENERPEASAAACEIGDERCHEYGDAGKKRGGGRGDEDAAADPPTAETATFSGCDERS